MGLFDQIFRPRRDRRRREAADRAVRFEGLGEAWRTELRPWDGEIYRSGLVRAAIDARARHISKLKIELHGSGAPALRARLSRGPDPWHTWSQFLYRASTILDVQNTCFIVPVLDEDLRTIGFSPVLPEREVEVVEYQGVTWLRFRFPRGERAAVELDRCAVLTRHQYRDDLFGTPNDAIRSTMELIHVQEQGIASAVRNSATYRFLARVGNFTSPADLAKERRRFSAKNLAADAEETGGVLLFPNTYTDIQQVRYSAYTANAGEMDSIRASVYSYFGVNDKILQNAAGADEIDAFYAGCVEPFAVQFAETMTRAVFSERERANGSRLSATADRLDAMGIRAKISMVQQLTDRGLLKRNEARAVFGLPPLPGPEGEAIVARGEYRDISDLGGGGEDGRTDRTDRTASDAVVPDGGGA